MGNFDNIYDDFEARNANGSFDYGKLDCYDEEDLDPYDYTKIYNCTTVNFTTPFSGHVSVFNFNKNIISIRLIGRYDAVHNKKFIVPINVETLSFQWPVGINKSVEVFIYDCDVCIGPYPHDYGVIGEEFWNRFCVPEAEEQIRQMIKTMYGITLTDIGKITPIPIEFVIYPKENPDLIIGSFSTLRDAEEVASKLINVKVSTRSFKELL
jgi:hypothetical protein